MFRSHFSTPEPLLHCHPLKRQGISLRLLLILITLLSLLLCTPPRTTQAAPPWGNTGSLGVQHALHTATLLPDGRVLVVGDTAPAG